jgi:tetratricopeptide (TPR) repeat protein
MKKSDDWEDIKVNRKKGNKVYFESTFIQQVSDGIDFLRNESKVILSEIDKTGVNDFDLEEFSQKTLSQIDDLVDDMAEFKSEIIDDEDIPEFVKESSMNAKVALNRDKDYVRRAKRRLDRLEGDDIGDERVNARVIELCDKALEVNGSNIEAYSIKGRALVNLERYGEAIDEFIEALAIERDNWDVWISIAEVNRLNRDYDDAISVYDKVLSENEDSFEAVKGKAIVYFDIDDYQNAVEFFSQANSIEELDDESAAMWEEARKSIQNA